MLTAKNIEQMSIRKKYYRLSKIYLTCKNSLISQVMTKIFNENPHLQSGEFECNGTDFFMDCIEILKKNMAMSKYKDLELYVLQMIAVFLAIREQFRGFIYTQTETKYVKKRNPKTSYDLNGNITSLTFNDYKVPEISSNLNSKVDLDYQDLKVCNGKPLSEFGINETWIHELYNNRFNMYYENINNLEEEMTIKMNKVGNPIEETNMITKHVLKTKVYDDIQIYMASFIPVELDIYIPKTICIRYLENEKKINIKTIISSEKFSLPDVTITYKQSFEFDFEHDYISQWILANNYIGFEIITKNIEYYNFIRRAINITTEKNEFELENINSLTSAEIVVLFSDALSKVYP